MATSTQKALLRELIDLHQEKSPYLDETWEQIDLNRYVSQEFFAKERSRISRALPQIAAHSTELPEIGSFLTLEIAGSPIFLVRDEHGVARAFYNVCRHRGAQLVGESSGSKQRFSCPYHAWTWNPSGELIAVPHEKTGFPGLTRTDYGLHAVACQEYAGWIWVNLSEENTMDVAAHLEDMAEDISEMRAGDHLVFDTSIRDLDANWKLLVEGGIESYHFRVAHKNTIASLFLDNLSSYQCFGPHIRSVLPRSTLPDLASQDAETWDFPKHANVLYSLFPGTQFLVQEDHFIWIQGIPLAPDRTRLRLSTLIPAAENTADKQRYWDSHHALTMTTLDEDFALAESIQKGMRSGANTHLNFGRFQGALAKFNGFVDEAIA